jgi:hypothetical protein
MYICTVCTYLCMYVPVYIHVHYVCIYICTVCMYVRMYEYMYDVCINVHVNFFCWTLATTKYSPSTLQVHTLSQPQAISHGAMLMVFEIVISVEHCDQV